MFTVLGPPQTKQRRTLAPCSSIFVACSSLLRQHHAPSLAGDRPNRFSGNQAGHGSSFAPKRLPRELKCGVTLPQQEGCGIENRGTQMVPGFCPQLPFPFYCMFYHMSSLSLA